MCEECRAAKAAALGSLCELWITQGPDGARLVAHLISLALFDERTPAERAKAVDNLMLDSWEASRRDAITILGAMNIASIQIKNRLLEEAMRAGDKRMMTLTWDTPKNGFWLDGKDRDGNPVHRFEPVAFGENAGEAANRIMIGHLESIGEVHG